MVNDTDVCAKEFSRHFLSLTSLDHDHPAQRGLSVLCVGPAWQLAAVIRVERWVMWHHTGCMGALEFLINNLQSTARCCTLATPSCVPPLMANHVHGGAGGGVALMDPV